MYALIRYHQPTCQDQLPFALRLTQIYLGDSIDSDLWELLFQGRVMNESEVNLAGVPAGLLSKEQACSIHKINKVCAVGSNY